MAEDPAKTYKNPVVNYSLPDPSVIRAEDGYFYLYATEDIRNLPIHRSKDLIKWESVGTAFTDETRPTFEPKGNLWAPDINKIGDKYVLYYSMSCWGGEWTCGIGVATADKPEGPFVDHGMMFRSNEIGVQNSIDPFYIEDGGRKYLFWGSFRGIYGIELTADGLKVKSGADKKQIAGTAYEGTYIHKNKSFVGTGHYAELITDIANNDWILYHGVSVSNPHGRVLLLDRVDWRKGWPVVKSSSASTESPKPNF